MTLFIFSTCSPFLSNNTMVLLPAEWIILHMYSLKQKEYFSLVSVSREKAMATHSSTLAWKIPWTEEPGRLQSMGSLRVGHNWATSLSLFTFMQWRRKWQPTPVFLPGESQGWGSLVGCRLWGRRVRHDWSDLAAAASLDQEFREQACIYPVTCLLKPFSFSYWKTQFLHVNFNTWASLGHFSF